MQDMLQALSAFVDALGRDNVLTDEESIARAETATFATRQRVPAVLRPADTSQVAACLRIASRFEVPVYPVSGGRNWGLGSRVPTGERSVVMDLSRMNRILEFDDRMGILTVEPGVTFRQVSEFLLENNAVRFLSVIGGPPEASVVGNALERGDAMGPHGERILWCGGFQVVLPRGDILETGFRRFGNTRLGPYSRWGVGPSLDGLFSQSNLGIVTQMTFWLTLRPASFQSFLFTMRDGQRMGEVVDRLRDLQDRGVVSPNSVAIWNHYKMIASEQQYPWESSRGQTPLLPDQLAGIESPWKKSQWIGVGGLYSASRAHGRADKRMVKRALKGLTDRLVFVGQTSARWALRFKGLLGRVTGVDIQDVVKTMYLESVFLGHPTRRSTKSTYWRKKTPLPPLGRMDPDLDRCGVIWLCPVVPYDAEHIRKAAGIVDKTALEFGFEPQMAFIMPNERMIYMFPSLVYDRDIDGEDERGMACHDSMLKLMIDEGYIPYRLGIQSMNSLPASMPAYARFMHDLKHLVDPKGVLAPGRYDRYGEDLDRSGTEQTTNHQTTDDAGPAGGPSPE